MELNIKKINILSFDGGGIRGIIELVQLIEFEKLLKLKGFKGELLDYFDYITGTSTGSIIAVMLSVGFKPTEILNLYLEHSNKIFNKGFLRFGLFRSKYDDTYFNNILKLYLGDKKLSDCKKNILIPTYNITKQDVVLFKSYKSNEDDKNYLLTDVIRTSASAPSYFDAYEINNELYVDGGLVINNPSFIMLYDVFKNIDKNDKFIINTLSFSTGNSNTVITKKDINGGILRSVDNVVDIMLREQLKLVDYQVDKFYNLFEKFTGNKLGNYYRAKSYVFKSSGKIDDVSKENIDNMIYDGKHSFQINLKNISKFIENL